MNFPSLKASVCHRDQIDDDNVSLFQQFRMLYLLAFLLANFRFRGQNRRICLIWWIARPTHDEKEQIIAICITSWSDRSIHIYFASCMHSNIYIFLFLSVSQFFKPLTWLQQKHRWSDRSMPQIKLDHPMMMISCYQKLFQTVQPDWPVEAPTCQPLVGWRRTQ